MKPAWLTPEVEAALGKWPDGHVARSHALPVTRRTLTRWRNRLGICSRGSVVQGERETLVPHIQGQVDLWRARFRVLRGWAILVQHDPVYGSQVKTIDTQQRRAVIYTAQGLPTDECDELGVPRDYALHEVLHLAWAAARALGPKEGEEILIQDLVWMLAHERGKAPGG